MIKMVKLFINAWFLNCMLGIFIWLIKHATRPEKRSEKIKRMIDTLTISEDDMINVTKLYINYSIPFGNLFILRSLNEYYKDWAQALSFFAFKTYYIMKEDDNMVLFMILVLILVLLITFLVIAISVGGSIAIILFGDVFVCIFIIAAIIKKMIKNRKNKDWA